MFWCKKVELSCGKQKRNGRVTYFEVRKWVKGRKKEKKGKDKIVLIAFLTVILKK